MWGGPNFIKSEAGKIRVEGAEVSGRWREYFKVFLTGEKDRELEVVEAVEKPLHEITEQEVKKEPNCIKNYSWTIWDDHQSA